MKLFLKLTKSLDKVLLYKSNGHCLLKELESENNLNSFSYSEIIEAVINTSFHLWMEDLKSQIYGFYDRSKITVSDYKKINKSAFDELIENAINYFTDDDMNYLKDVKISLKNICQIIF